MNSDNANGPTEPKDIASARVRTQSECSITSDEGSASNPGKR